MKRGIFYIFLFFLGAIGTDLFSITFEWKSRKGEPAFSMDIPSDWLYEASVRPNGVIIKFSNSQAEIEVRSFLGADIPSRKGILNSKAARLGAFYGTVYLLEEYESKYNADLYRATWEVSHRNRRYTDNTAFIIDDNGVVVLSCLVPSRAMKKYKIVCENAIYSLRGLESEPRKSSELTDFIFTNLPLRGNKKVPRSLPPKAIPEAEKKQKEKATSPDKPLEEESFFKDNFLPELQ